MDNALLRQLGASCLDLAPVLVVIVTFQLGVIRQPLPELFGLLSGVGLTVLGLTFFVLGLEQALFPLGEAMVYAFARKGSLGWLTRLPRWLPAAA